MTWLQKLFGMDRCIGVLRAELSAMQTSLLELTNKVDTLTQAEELNTKRTLKGIQIVFDRVTRFEKEFLKIMPENEENDIEKAVDDDMDLSSGERVPIRNGMKVRYEDDDKETEIRLE